MAVSKDSSNLSNGIRHPDLIKLGGVISGQEYLVCKRCFSSIATHPPTMDFRNNQESKDSIAKVWRC